MRLLIVIYLLFVMVGCTPNEDTSEAKPLKFEFNTKLLKIESENPSIFVVPYIPDREGGRRFVFHYNNSVIGFKTAEYFGDDQTEELDDGSYFWRIGMVGCRIREWNREHRKYDIIAKPYKFKNKEEQEIIMDMFLEALKAFKGFFSETSAPYSKAEYTKEIIWCK